MAKKQVILNEEMIRGIMAGDIPNYGKDIPEDAFITVDESEQSDCETNNPEPAPVEKSAAKQRKRKDGTDSYRKQFKGVVYTGEDERILKNLRVAYVGMSRARYLLCVAIQKNRFDNMDCAELREIWDVVDA